MAESPRPFLTLQLRDPEGAPIVDATIGLHRDAHAIVEVMALPDGRPRATDSVIDNVHRAIVAARDAMHD